MSISLTRRQVLLLGCGLLAALALVGTRLARSGAASQQTAVSTAARPLRAVPAPASMLVIDVVGAVRRPGLYRLRDGSRIADAVQRAGGATRRADLAVINLAAPVVDGMQVVVPVRGAAVSAGAGPSGAGAGSVRVSLSSATVDQLDALPGIGPVTAQKIVDYRTQHGPFRSIQDLMKVTGIGQKKFDSLQAYVTV